MVFGRVEALRGVIPTFIGNGVVTQVSRRCGERVLILDASHRYRGLKIGDRLLPKASGHLRAPKVQVVIRKATAHVELITDRNHPLVGSDRSGDVLTVGVNPSVACIKEGGIVSVDNGGSGGSERRQLLFRFRKTRQSLIQRAKP